MKTFAALAFLCIAFTSAVRADQTTTQPQMFDERAAMTEARFVDGTGKVLTLDQLRGHVVLLSFFGSWCPPCVAEFPSILRMYKTLSSEGHELEMVFVSGQTWAFDKDNQFLKDHGIGWRSHRWEQRPYEQKRAFFKIYDKSQLIYFPTTIILDRNGNMAAWYHTHEWSNSLDEVRRVFEQPYSPSAAPEPSMRTLATKWGIPLPQKIDIASPSASVPAQVAGYLGSWGGERWGGVGRFFLVAVTSVDSSGTATGIYAWGPPTQGSFDQNKAGYSLFSGSIDEGGLHVALFGWDYTFLVTQNSLLKAEGRNAKANIIATSQARRID